MISENAPDNILVKIQTKRQVDLLCHAIGTGDAYTFETTLGGNSITNKLHEAIERGRQVSIFYCGLASVELHIERVAARVQRGGHHIPVEKIHQRYETSISNLVALIPVCQQLLVFDNSAPLRDGRPSPIKLFHLVEDRFAQIPIPDIPEWAKPLAGSTLKRVHGEVTSLIND